MEGNYVLECCVDSVESAINAEAGGADRFELCGNLIIGGTTPDLALFKEVRKNTKVKTHVLLRPRFGDFLYTDYELAILKENVRQFLCEGADGIVIGCLTKKGELNQKFMQELIKLSGSMKVTLHRAFDVCNHPFQTLKEAIDLGVDIILTSGQANTCYEGRELIGELINKAEGKIDIMAGAGVNDEIIKKIKQEIPVRSFHMSGKKILESSMEYRKEGVSMGLPFLNEYEIWQTDRQAVARAKSVLC